MGVGAGLYMYDVVVKRSRSLSYLLMSSCSYIDDDDDYCSLYFIVLYRAQEVPLERQMSTVMRDVVSYKRLFS